jgi:hypothetical protein
MFVGNRLLLHQNSIGLPGGELNRAARWKGRNMRLNKWIMGGLLAGGLVFRGVQHASAYTVSDLYGTWTGTDTILQDPPPQITTTSGTTDYSAGPGFFNPLPFTESFAASHSRLKRTIPG